MINTTEYIKNKVHELYWKEDMNCARTTLTCLSELFQIPIEKQTMISARGLHGAGGYRAQCGLVEGSLMFIGIYCDHIGVSEEETVQSCYEFAEAFEKRFGSLRCRELRPSGFSETDPPHMCEGLTCVAIAFAYQYINHLERRETTMNESKKNETSKKDALFENGQALVNEVKEKLQDRSYSFDLTSKMQLKSDCKEIEKYLKLISKGKAKEKDTKQLEVAIVRLRTTIDGLIQYYTR